jgi:hypothetical protein
VLHAIKMLTEDETTLRLAELIGQVVAAELGDINRTLELVKTYELSRSPQALYNDARRKPEREERETAMSSRMRDLVDSQHHHFSTALAAGLRHRDFAVG